eukprot:363865-Chlamydomonas_euryale.AAC.32
MLAPQVVLTADDLVDYLLTAHHYAQRIVTSAIVAAYTLPREQLDTLFLQRVEPPARPELPETQAGWATFEFTDQVGLCLSSQSRL